MNSYIVILLGSMLGMLLLITVKSAYIRQSSKYTLGFIDSFKVYTTKHTGPILVGFIIVFICMFILPEIMAMAQAGNQEGMYAKVINNVVGRLRIYSVGIGILGQGIGFLIIRKGEKYLRDEEEKLLKEKPE
jgi:hypothetical protein